MLMGVYHSLLLPPLLHLAMKDAELSGIRERLIPLARGRVLEVGCGAGLNLPHYGHWVQELWAVDPSPALMSIAYRRAKNRPFAIEFLERTARHLSRSVMRNIRQNLFLDFVYSLLGVPVAASILYPVLRLVLSPITAAAAMSLSSLSVVNNARRLRAARL